MKPREWTVYVKLGRVLGEPRMDAEAVKVREVTTQDESKDNYAEVRAEVERLLDRLYLATEVLHETLGALMPYDKDGNVSPIVEKINDVLAQITKELPDEQD